MNSTIALKAKHRCLMNETTTAERLVGSLPFSDSEFIDLSGGELSCWDSLFEEDVQFTVGSA